MPQITTDSQVVDVTIPALTSEQNVPIVVASGSIVNSGGGDLSATTLYTPTTPGIFRVSWYFEGTGNYLGSAYIYLNWTDDEAARSVDVLSNSMNPPYMGSWTVRAIADPIQLSTSGNVYSAAYTIYYVVEQLA